MKTKQYGHDIEHYSEQVCAQILAAAAALEQGKVNDCLDALRKATAAAQTLERHVLGVTVPRRGK